MCHTSIKYKVLGIGYPNEQEIIAGTLVCKKNHRFAIENGIPMLRANQKMEIRGYEDTKINDNENYSTLPLKQRQKRVKALVKKLIHVERARTRYAKGILERDIDYRTNYSRKDKYVELIRQEMKILGDEDTRRRGDKDVRILGNRGIRVQTILELGIGQGGFATSLKEGFKPTKMIGLDYDPDWARVAKLTDPSIDVIVGDATNLPIKSGSIDLVAAAYLLEHIRDWKTVIDQAQRVGTHSFFIWSPNKNFPWDYGHFRNAPLLPWLPASIGQYIAWGIAHAKGFNDTLGQCRNEIETMNYVSPGQFENYLRTKQITYRDSFLPFVWMTLDQSYQYWRLARLLKAMKPLAMVFFSILHVLHVQPMLVYFLNHPKGSRR